MPTPARSRHDARRTTCCTAVGITNDAAQVSASSGHARSDEAVLGSSDSGAAGVGTATKSRTSRWPEPRTPDRTTQVATNAEIAAPSTGASRGSTRRRRRGWSAAARDGAAWVDTGVSLVAAPTAPGRTLSRVSRSTARAQTARGAVLVAVGMTAMNVAAYAFTLVAARRLGPDGYSVVAALMGVVLVVNVLALGVQATTARHVAQHGDDPRIAADMLRTAGRSALALGALCLVLSPVAARLLRLDSWLTAATVAVTAAALTVTGAQLGILQGHQSWRAFAGLCLTTGAGRLLVGGTAVVLWPTPLGAMTGVALGALLPLVVGRRLTRSRAALPAGPVDSRDATPRHPSRRAARLAHPARLLRADPGRRLRRPGGACPRTRRASTPRG